MVEPAPKNLAPYLLYCMSLHKLVRIEEREKKKEKNWGSQFTRNPPFISQPNWECKWVLRFPYWAEYLHVDYQLSNLSQRESRVYLFECAHFDLLMPIQSIKRKIDILLFFNQLGKMFTVTWYMTYKKW